MKVVRIHGAGDIRTHEEAPPQAKRDEVLIQVEAVGICGSDLHWFGEGAIGDAQLKRPLVLGHEMAGIVQTGKYAGQRVAIDPCVPCGKCENCQQGDPNLCMHQRFAGHAQEDGGLREWMTWPEDSLFPLPETFTAEDGVMLEPLGVALYALDLAGIRPGWTVGVFGCGPIGLLAVQLAQFSGASLVTATEHLPRRLIAAASYGAQIVPAADGAEIEQIMKITNGRGLDCVIEAAGSNSAVTAALETVRPGGRVILAGIPDDDTTTVRASLVRRKGLALQWVRRMKHTYPRAIDLVQRGKVDVRNLVSDIFSLEESAAAFASAQMRTGLKTIIRIHS